MTTPRSRLPRLVVLSHSAVEPSHLRKWALVARAGWEVLLLVPESWPEAGRLQRGKTGREGRLRSEVVRGLAGGRLARWTPLGLRSRLSGFRPDLVHAEEEPFGMACWMAWRAARSLRVPFSFFTWENIRRRYLWPQERMMAGVLGGAAGAIAGNGDAVRVLRGRGFRSPVAVLPQYGFDPRVFRPRSRAGCRHALGWPAFGPVAGYIGRLLPEKGVETLIRASARIPSLRVAIVGSGPHEPVLRALAGRLLPGRSIFAGAMRRERISVVMGALDVLVLPSRTTPAWKEQFGRVLAEAMGAGRWVLGSSSGEIPAVIGSRSLVFPEGNIPALARRLRFVIGRRPPASLRRRAVARFSDAAIVRGTGAFLRRLLKGG